MTATTVLPAASAGAISATRPSSGGSSGATTPTTPVGSGSEKRQERRGDRVDAAQHGGRACRSSPRSATSDVDRRRADARSALGGQLVGARLERLGGAVEDLAAVVGGARRPRAGRLARGATSRRARPCATRAGRWRRARRRRSGRGRSGRTPSARTRLPRRACRSWRTREPAHDTPQVGTQAGRAALAAEARSPCSRRRRPSGRTGCRCSARRRRPAARAATSKAFEPLSVQMPAARP